MVSNSSSKPRRKLAPKIIVAALAIAVAVYILFEILQDIFVEGAPVTSGPLIGAIVSFTRNVTDTVGSWRYAGVFGLMLIEASSLPVPSEVVLPLAGFLVSQGELDFWLTLAVSTIAALTGSLIDYFIGLKGVQVLVKYKVLGRAIFSQNQLETAVHWFNKYGAITVFLGRLVPVFRTFISFPAGAVKMPLAKFVAYTTFGCIIWNSLLIYVGYYLGSNWREVADVLHYVVIAVVIIVVVIAVIFLIHKKRNDKKKNLQSKFKAQL